jgi:hypothetical protein
MRVTVSSDLRWIDSVLLPLDEAESLVRSLHRFAPSKKKDVIERLRLSSDRMKVHGVVQAQTLVNLLVNSDGLIGENAPKVADFLVSHGADASVETAPGFGSKEHWIVLYNPAKIISAVPVKAKEVSPYDYDIPFERPSGIIHVSPIGMSLFILAAITGASIMRTMSAGK